MNASRLTLTRNGRTDRRGFIAASAATCLAASGQTQADLPAADTVQSTAAQVLLPRDRVPVSFIIDDSTCLVNMGYFCTPQFATAWPGRAEYQKPWRTWPAEIPDDFVREFGQWCAEHGVKGKYSVVPYPACVGWMDRMLPGWSRRQLRDSLDLVRTLMLPNWDIHPEMISHTRVLDLRTGRPIEAINDGTMENSFPQNDVSVDHLTEYLAYALRILKNCDLPCQGITTPGGFGNRVKQKLPIATHQAVRDVYGASLPHYFKYVRQGEQSTEPELEFVGADGDMSNVTVNVPAGTGDWYGGWQGDGESEPDRYVTRDGQSGRMAELIQRRQPAVMLCHWPGMYCNGTKSGFQAFQRNVLSLAEHYGDQIHWMKVSEIASYWAAKQCTTIRPLQSGYQFDAVHATGDFTVQLDGVDADRFWFGDRKQPLDRVTDRRTLRPGSYCSERGNLIVCVDLPVGRSQLTWG
ncbi:hypothetical protein [Crateriforma conspicua]|uniref:Uncharacterized protein n=1 Tax=Crateriforma conspicua TaxID=2527996 RepID=A0A5C5Y8K8_9PLAN|nr:hypothetical protein [Crateriforma conspicua]TWT70781.1 hypothetical protein Pan14r_30890 [Crateriforma conspicua]